MRLPLNSGWLERRRLARGSRSEESGVVLPSARFAILAHLRASDVGGSAEPREKRQAQEAMRDLCHDAHRRHLQAEQLLIAVKDAWRALPEARLDARRAAPHASLDRFISLCIAEYYARRD